MIGYKQMTNSRIQTANHSRNATGLTKSTTTALDSKPTFGARRGTVAAKPSGTVSQKSMSKPEVTKKASNDFAQPLKI